MESPTVSPAPPGQVATAPALPPPAPSLPWVPIGWFLGLILILFFPVIKTMVWEWALIQDMGHAFFVPLLAGYVVWQDREKIMRQPVKPCWPALILVVWAFAQMLLGILGADFFLARTAFLLAIVGVIWTLAGTAVLRSLAFPLLLLLFMIRIPLFIYQQITFKLQILASQLATAALGLVGIPVLRDGNVLELPTQRLEVVEACSGIRSLLSLSFLSLAYAHLFDRRGWMKPVLFIATVPIAIFANACRITLTGILGGYNKELAEGVYHEFEGWVVFMVALAVLLLVHRLICRFTRASHA